MFPISPYITLLLLLPETPKMSLRPGMTRLELSHRASPQPHISLAWPFGREHKQILSSLAWSEEGCLRARVHGNCAFFILCFS